MTDQNLQSLQDDDVIVIEGVLPENTNTIQTSIAQISLTPNVVETSAFQQVLLDIPFHVGNADNLLKAYRDDPEAFLETLDEELIDEQLEQMKTVSVFVKNVEKARLEIKRYMNDVRDNMINELDAKLNEAKYDQLGQAQADIKQLKKDIDADRATRRWEELKVTFIANLNRYPAITQFTVELTDFSKFKLLFPNLVSGAKTRKVKPADHAVINETLHSWNTAIEIMKENVWGLSIHDINKLLTMFKRDPSIEMINREGRQLKLNEEAEERARVEAKARQEAEQARLKVEEERRKKELLEYQAREAQAKKEQDVRAQEAAKQQRLALEEKIRQAEINEKKIRDEFNQFGGQYRTIFKESFPMFIEYLFKNNHYHDVHSNPATKAGIIYDIMKQVDNPSSVVVKETANDPTKILDLVRYVLDA